jgi:hypothetical protein
VSVPAIAADQRLCSISRPRRPSARHSQQKIVQKVSPDGLITTVAGTGVAGSAAGDGGRATDAQFVYITGLALAPDGGFYVSEQGGLPGTYNRIRRVDVNGIITTIAGAPGYPESGDGGPATSAELGFSRGIAVGPDGSVYVAIIPVGDSGSALVRRVAPDGIITTVAGKRPPYLSRCLAEHCGLGGPATAATLSWPTKLAVGPDGTLVFVDGARSSTALLARMKARFRASAAMTSPSRATTVPRSMCSTTRADTS